LREIDEEAIRSHAEIRFRSEYHYALFEYHRSAKILKRLEWEEVPVHGNVLDAGCGSGGIAVSFAEECELAVGLDIKNKFGDAGRKLASERGIQNAVFVQGDGTALPFESGRFDLVLSHSVLEHVESAEHYLEECHRVLRSGGVLFLQTPPHLSFAGSHLSRLRVPIPIHLLLPRSWAFRLNFYIARKRPQWLKEPREDDLIQKVTVARVHRWLERAGFELLREERHVSGFFTRNLPSAVRRLLEENSFTQNVVISNLELLLRKSKP
jgi:ubiquinone/menaquinone biosynthesis C-methylase UbiE